MIEVINGALLIYFFVLCLLNNSIKLLVKPIASCFLRTSHKELSIWSEILKLKEEQKKLSMKDDFAAYSKLQRKINLHENELKDNSQSRLSKSLAIKGSIHLFVQVLVVLLIFGSIFWFVRKPVAKINGNLFPLGSLLSYPCSMPNSISINVWILISNVALRTLLKPILS